MTLFYISLGISLIIVITFFFPWVSIRALDMFYGGLSIIGGLELSIDTLEKLRHGDPLVNYILISMLIFALQFIIPLMNAVYIILGLPRIRFSCVFGRITSVISASLIVLFFLWLIVANLVVYNETGGLISYALSFKPTPIIIFILALINRFVVQSMIKKLGGIGRGGKKPGAINQAVPRAY
jgi:hypothetical protein